MSVIAASAVTVRIGTKTLLDGASLVVAPGEVVALVGPNGAGKSTLLRVLAGELAPASGAVMLKGRALASYSSRELALRRAVLSQSTHVAFPFTVGEVVRMGAGDRGGAAIDALADVALADVDLGAFGERVITTLSGGEQQRAHFARVLVQLACGEQAHGPGLLLLDEPTASLDPDTGDWVRGYLELYRRETGATVLLASHNMLEVERLCDDVLMMKEGRIVDRGAPAELIARHGRRTMEEVFLAIARAPATRAEAAQ
jgi:iron complex transport system ATP-binding protein